MTHFIVQDLVVILCASLVVVGVLRRLGVPTIAGFILTGVTVGPSGLALIRSAHEVEVLAEIGVVLLLFSIGMELSVERIRRLWVPIVVGGAFQVVVTIGVTAFVGAVWGLPTSSAVFLGCLVAVSSTAVVLRGLSERNELEAPHGRLALGILVFQDLCVIPMVLALPLLGGQEPSVLEACTDLAVAGGVLLLVVICGRFIAPRLLALLGRGEERDLFVLALGLLCLGTAWLLSLVGVSLALGAFVSGLTVASSEHRHRALQDVIPLREVFASVFFVSVGMLLDVHGVASEVGTTVAILFAILGAKFVIVLATALLLKHPLQSAVLAAGTLCQVGEFSFVLLNAAGPYDLLPGSLATSLLAAIVLSMLLTPVLVAAAPRMATRAVGIQKWLLKPASVGEAGRA